MSDERDTGDTPAPDSAASDSARFRSRQQTLAMGGNVNEPKRMPSLVEIAEELAVRAPPANARTMREPEAQRLKDVALRAIAESKKPVPPNAALGAADDSETAPPSLQDFWRRDSRPTEPGPPGHFDIQALGPAPEPVAETLSAQLKEPSETHLERRSSSSALDRLSGGFQQLNKPHRWAGVAVITLLALAGGFWLGSGLEKTEEGTVAVTAPSSVTPTLRDNAIEGAGSANVATPEPATSSESEPVATPGIRDQHFAVRQPVAAASCDRVLGKPFQVEAEPNPGKGGAYWSRSRRSLLNGLSDRALEQMCLSASWDLSGRGTYGLSEYFFQKADFDQALVWAKRVPEGSKRYGDARAMMGDVYSQQGRVAEALEAYTSYWNLDLEDSDERADLAVRFANSASMARRKGDWWTAERFYRRALTLDPNYAFAAAGLARVFSHFELHEATVHWAERALSLDEKDAVQAAIALCETWLRKKDRAGAERALATLKRVEPSHPLVRSVARQIERL